MRTPRPLAPLALLTVLAAPALGHEADLLYVYVARDAGEITQTLTLTGGSLALLAPVDGDGDGLVTAAELTAALPAIEAGVWAGMPLAAGGRACELLETGASPRQSYLSLWARFSCPEGELSQVFRLLSDLPDGYHVVVADAGGAGLGQRFAQGQQQTVYLPEPATRASSRQSPGLGGWLRLGVFHIFTGFDHLCFLVALLLVTRGLWQVLGLVTAFTVAHSITLGAAALGHVPLSAGAAVWVEAAIAASIVFVAADNLLRKEHRHRAWLTFGFGLVHGFGFAGVLQGYGLGEGAAFALLGFNLGVELGQAALVVALYPLLRWLERRPLAATWTVRVGSGSILLLGVFWFVERALG